VEQRQSCSHTIEWNFGNAARWGQKTRGKYLKDEWDYYDCFELDWLEYYIALCDYLIDINSLLLDINKGWSW